WMKNNSDLRADPSKILPGAKSIICLATNYFNSVEPRLHEDGVKIARYAWSKNYHKIIEKRLKRFEEFIKKLAPKAKIKRYVDTGPFLERYYASQAGLGFIGKNNCLITREFGSFVFLAEIITDLALLPDKPSRSSPSCGTCTRCIDACPTGALKPHNLDARKCISYLTIESKKPFPKSLRAKIKPWIFGCDMCQNACPHNVRATPTKNPDFALAAPLRTLTLSQLRAIKTEDEFKDLFAGTSLIRAKFKGMKRNIK
ncbi:MAG: tRNA epoxyqueuosine(34) reductase QueG, partial [Candidatus Gracilibacteria bacterium]